MYSIDGLLPSGGMGGYGFAIYLSTQYRHQVALSGITQEGADRAVKTFSQAWRNHSGYGGTFDIENSGVHTEKREIPSNKCKPLYDQFPRVKWGEWGTEVIEVPGSASGLYLDRRSTFNVFGDKGAVLHSHNMDCWNQVILCLLVFTWFSHSITLTAENRTCSP